MRAPRAAIAEQSASQSALLKPMVATVGLDAASRIRTNSPNGSAAMRASLKVGFTPQHVSNQPMASVKSVT